MTRRINKGRQRVEMVKMKNAKNLGVTFSKRRVGLFKQASELCMLYGAEIAIVVFSPNDKVYSFGHPSVDTLVEWFLGRNLPPPNNDVHNQQIVACREAGISEVNTKLMNLKEVLHMEKNRGESNREIMKRANSLWWKSHMEELDLFQFQHLKKALEILKQKVEKEAQMVNNNAFLGKCLDSS
ncbi:hypothetical protein MTR67_018702 [Solanum verrucosum]|uniref:MADS-box domain-containing protein n=1 Tax=Solanum verrucosum TaxID=315347 RepID=A0AAF0QK56_SOLVR|nr:hypothetical protein MTR67_018702 [Solanum verrucosum]